MTMRSLISALLVIWLTSSCAGTATKDAALYRALGEREGIQALTDEFLYSLSENDGVIELFANTDIGRFREQFATQLCAVSGGPCTYEGDSMRDTHRGMDINRAQFNSVVDDLIDAMERLSLPTATQNALLQRLAPMYGDIVGL